ncbi:hypothetical protein FISHEDRAFT_75681 [Fistulina hepatica ATCC 64428]|uniref:Uncharacterized protein n=1 Tax=Fistulina hepatica ATCC 64428 TaxID=1128425 RepID=A0A0D7A934_9AGAR|nr:hypothetical protein FISHEDRAFT_75681 [Fistulina hepatica ATCC 64428]
MSVSWPEPGSEPEPDLSSSSNWTEPDRGNTTPNKPTDLDDNFCHLIPDKYKDYADSIFNPQEFEKLPSH